MAKTHYLVVALALMAVAAIAAPAPGCKSAASKQTSYLQTATPANCLNENITSGLVDVACFESVMLNTTNTTGATCATAGVIFNVTFVNKTCLDGMIIGGGKITPGAKGSPDKLTGELATGMQFNGIYTPAGTFTVSVDGVNCELAYGPTKRTGPLVAAAKAVDPNVDVTAVIEAPAAANGTDAAAAPTTAKSSAAAAGLNAVVMVLGAALALAF